MTYSRYIGRVGALAVALGIGAAVASTPGIAFAEGTESDAPGAEAPSNPSPNEPDDQQPAAGDPSDGGEEQGSLTEPPDMNVGGTTIDTSTNDGSAGEGNEDEQEAQEEVEEEVEGVDEDLDEDEEESEPLDSDQQTPPANNGSGNALGPQQQNQNALRQPETNTAGDDSATLGTQRKAAAVVDDNTSTLSLRTAALDNADATGPTETFSSLALDEAEEEQNPIAALISLPLRIVSEVLTAIVGGPNTPPGENPLFLGLLAFVRRPFETFSRSFSNDAPVIDDYSLVENPDGTFTITVDTAEPDVDAFDPDGDDLTFSATDGEEGTVVKTGANTFVYTPGDDFDGDDTFTLTVSDTGGLFGANRKTDTITVAIEAGGEDPTEPEVTQPPTQQPDGSVEAKLEFDPTKVADVTIAEGFEPKYWTVQKTYNAATGELELKFTPTQAGMLRAALELPTIDSVGLQVTTTEETVQTFASRSASFAALADAPDYTLDLPELPTGHFEIRPESPITTTGGPNPEDAYPAGVVVTDRYAYVLNSRYLGGTTENSTVTVFGADPEHTEDYLQIVDEIEVGGGAIFAGLAGDRLYVVNLGRGGDDSSISIIDTDGADAADEDDDNSLVDTDDSTPEIDPIALEGSGSFSPLVSPDGKRIYVINQQAGKLLVIDTDSADLTGTYNTVVDEIQISPPFGSGPTPDPETGAITFRIPMSGAFNADGSRLFVVRDIQSQTPTDDGVEFGFDAELIVIDTDPTSGTYNEVIGDPITLGGYGGYASSDGKFLYVPTLEMDDYDPMNPDLSTVGGSVAVVDIQGAVPVVIDTNLATPEIDRLPVGNLPINIAFSPDKSLAYIVEAGSGNVTVIDTVNRQVLDLDPDTEGVQGLKFDEDAQAESLIAFNVIASSPDGTQLYVTNFNDGTVTAIEFVVDEEVV